MVRCVSIGSNLYKLHSSLFSEEYIAIAILRLVEMEKAVVEGRSNSRAIEDLTDIPVRYIGAGAAGLAAVLQGLLPELKGKK